MDKVWKIVKKMKYNVCHVSESGISALIKITSSCRSRCQYCLSWKTAPDILPLSEVYSIIEDIRKFAAHRIVLSGGEPTSHSDFAKIIEKCATINSHVTVITDGQYPVKSTWIPMVDEITFSIDTYSPDLYKLIRGINGLSKALENLAVAVKSGVTVSVNIVLSHQALLGLEKTVELLVNRGVSKIYFLELETHLLVSDNLIPSDNDLLIFRENLLPSLQRKYPGIVPHGKALPARDEASYKRGGTACIIPWMQMTIRPNGDLFPCCRIGDDNPESNGRTFCLGNVKEISICDVWQSIKRKRVQTLIATIPPLPCRMCAIGELFQNEDEIWNQIESIRM